MVIVYSPRCLDYAAPGHPETPDRVRAAVAQLHKQSHTWVTPEPCTDDDILRVHSREMLDTVRTGSFSDADTPVFPQIHEIAKLAAGGAVQAAQQALTGRPAFSLMRPPGHHATPNHVMGFCYFNNIAIAVARSLETRNPKLGPQDAEESGLQSAATVNKVAILDFDCHHGNGTEDVFRGDERILFVSLHQAPCYPGTGLTTRGNCLNYPLPPGTGPDQFLAAFDDGLDRIRAFRPDLLAVSAGFDAHRDDPITQMGLEIETFHDVGRRIANFTSPGKMGAGGTRPLPCFAVLEGGYSREFARCVEAFVSGWDGH
jgi:acetoin utilization deacetylase AcuC-like enzyme